jgi:glucose-6-phosphate isomerase
MLPKINPEQTKAWQNLQDHFANNDFELRELFQNNPNRFREFSVQRDGYLFDFSKNLINDQTLELLLKLADETELKEAVEAMFIG